jgi:hypothetical protein
VSHHEDGDWQLVVKINGDEVLNTPVSAQTVQDGWLTVEVDLAKHAGETIRIEVLNQPTEWFYEAGYWGEISILGV